MRGYFWGFPCWRPLEGAGSFLASSMIWAGRFIRQRACLAIFGLDPADRAIPLWPAPGRRVRAIGSRLPGSLLIGRLIVIFEDIFFPSIALSDPDLEEDVHGAREFPAKWETPETLCGRETCRMKRNIHNFHTHKFRVRLANSGGHLRLSSSCPSVWPAKTPGGAGASDSPWASTCRPVWFVLAGAPLCTYYVRDVGTSYRSRSISFIGIFILGGPWLMDPRRLGAPRGGTVALRDDGPDASRTSRYFIAKCAATMVRHHDLTEVRELAHCDDGLCLCHLAASPPRTGGWQLTLCR